MNLEMPPGEPGQAWINAKVARRSIKVKRTEVFLAAMGQIERKHIPRRVLPGSRAVGTSSLVPQLGLGISGVCAVVSGQLVVV